MRTSTKIAIGGYIGWFVCNIKAGSEAPTNLPGFNERAQGRFVEQIEIANAWQSFGNLLLLIAVICTIITLYKNIMSKNINKTVMGHEITADRGAIVATDEAAVATGNATIEQNSANTQSYRDHIHSVRTSLKDVQLSDKDGRHADMILEKLESCDPSDPAQSPDINSLINDLHELLKDAKTVASPILDAVKKIYQK